MATITTTGSGNWSSATPNAPWPSGTKPVTGDVVEVGAGHTLTIDENTAVLGAAGLKNVTGSNTSAVSVSGTVTLNGSVAHSGTNTFVTVPAGTNLTINGGTSNSSTGSAVATTSTGVLTISNAGGNAAQSTGNAACISAGGSGVLLVTGDVVCSAASGGRGISYGSSATTSKITGNVSCSNANSNGLRATSGMIEVDGNISGTNAGVSVMVAGGTVKWTGARNLAADTDAKIVVSSGTLNLTSLVLSLSGRLLIDYQTGTITEGSGGTKVRAIKQSSAAQACVGGKAVDFLGGPTLPAVTDVANTAPSYGFAGSPLTGTLDVSGQYVGGYTDGYAAGEIAQYATDQAAVLAEVAYIDATQTILGQTGTLHMDVYTLIAGVAAAADVRLNTPRYTGGPLGQLVVQPVGGVYPLAVQVDGGVQYGPTGTEYVGTGMDPAALIDGIRHDDLLAYVKAVTSGISSGVAPNPITYYAPDGVTWRVRATTDVNNNRTLVEFNPPSHA